jgi:hypothetical protein
MRDQETVWMWGQKVYSQYPSEETYTPVGGARSLILPTEQELRTDVDGRLHNHSQKARFQVECEPRSWMRYEGG